MTYQNPQVGFVNESTVLTYADVEAIRAACSFQVHYQFGPSWHTGCRTVLGKPLEPDGWSMVFRDDSDVQGALGYHDLSTEHPVSYVFARTCKTYGVQPSSCASHELLEMLADPRIDRCVQTPRAWGTTTGACFTAMEACDAVEQSEYDVNGLKVSDFVMPAWFDAASAGPWDWMGVLPGPLTLEPGGSYIGFFTPTTGWQSRNADGEVVSDPDDMKFGDGTPPRNCHRPFQRRERSR